MPRVSQLQPFRPRTLSHRQRRSACRSIERVTGNRKHAARKPIMSSCSLPPYPACGICRETATKIELTLIIIPFTLRTPTCLIYLDFNEDQPNLDLQRVNGVHSLQRHMEDHYGTVPQIIDVLEDLYDAIFTGMQH